MSMTEYYGNFSLRGELSSRRGIFLLPCKPLLSGLSKTEVINQFREIIKTEDTTVGDFFYITNSYDDNWEFIKTKDDDGTWS